MKHRRKSCLLASYGLASLGARQVFRLHPGVWDVWRWNRNGCFPTLKYKVPAFIPFHAELTEAYGPLVRARTAVVGTPNYRLGGTKICCICPLLMQIHILKSELEEQGEYFRNIPIYFWLLLWSATTKCDCEHYWFFFWDLNEMLLQQKWN